MDKRKRNRLLYCLAIVCFAVAALLAVYLIFFYGGSETAKTETEDAETAVVSSTAPTPDPVPDLDTSSHAWESGVCTICGLACRHEEHVDNGPFHSAICLRCGMPVSHIWENGSCITCGTCFEFVEEQLPDAVVDGTVLQPAERGTVITTSYPSYSFLYGTDFEKNITVYLPAGYDENGSYPLLLMCVGSGSPSYFYLEGYGGHTYFDTDVGNCAAMFDYVIAEGICEPFIAATIEHRNNPYTYYADFELDRRQMSTDIPKYILPWLCENYALCIPDCSAESLEANRDRLSFTGVSYGAYICCTSAFQDNYGLFGRYCAVSGSWAGGDDLKEAAEASDLPLYYFYACDGEPDLDECAPLAKNAYYEFDALSDKLTDGVNGHAGTIQDGTHEIPTWLTAMFNFVRLCF